MINKRFSPTKRPMEQYDPFFTVFILYSYYYFNLTLSNYSVRNELIGRKEGWCPLKTDYEASSIIMESVFCCCLMFVSQLLSPHSTPQHHHL